MNVCPYKATFEGVTITIPAIVNRYFLFMLLLCFTATGCDDTAQSQALRQKEDSLQLREQQLEIREKEVELKEAAWIQQQQLSDSNFTSDSNYVVDSAFIGNWNVMMTCTEATCPGSAVGDTKNEIWNFFYKGKTLVATATSNGQLVRTYSGFYAGNLIELREKRDTAVAHVRMVVRLRIVDEINLEGQREITRETCKIIYNLKLQKDE